MANANDNFGAALKAMRKNWKEGKVESKRMFGVEDLPDEGKYEAQLTVCKLEKMNDGKLVITREFVLSSGEHQGVVLRDRMFIENSFGAAFADRWIQSHGYESPEDPSQLPDILEAIQTEQPICNISAKRNGNYMNVSVLAVIGAGEAQEAVEGDEEEAVEGDEEATEEEATEEEATEEEEAEEEATEEEEAVEGDEDSELKERLMSFCATQGIDATEENTVEEIKEAINGFNYKSEELSDDEVAILTEIGLEGNIVKKAAPVKASPTKAPTKVPTKAPTKVPTKAPTKVPAKAPVKATPAKAGVKKITKK